MKKVLVLLIVLVVAACIVGYFTFLKPKPEKKKARAELQPVAQETPEEKKARLEQDLKSIQRFVDTNPLDLREIERRVKEFSENAGASSFLAIRAERILSDAKSNFEEQARKAYSSIEGRAQEFIARIQAEEGPADGKKKDYGKVLEIINSFPSDFAQTDCYTKLRQLRDEVKSYIDACDVWEKHRMDAVAAYRANDHDRAIRILNDFPEKYQISEWEKERQKLLSQYQGEKETAIAKEEAEQKLVWHALYSGESDLRKADWDPQPESAFAVKDGVLVITCPSGQDFVCMSTGAGDWAEFILELDMRIVRGSLMFAVRGTVETADESSKTYRFDKVVVGKGDFQSDIWQKVKVRVKDNRIIVSSPALRGTREDNCDRKSGPVGLFVLNNAEVQIKSIKIAFYSPEPDSWTRKQAAKEEKKQEEQKPKEGE